MEKSTIDKVNESNSNSFKKLGYTKLETAEIVTAMNNLLADFSVHYQNLRNFHWNVKGGDFFDIHEQFELQYEAAKKAIDEIAERIRVFGMTPLSTLKEYLETAEIQEAPYNLSGIEMVHYILDDYRILLEKLFQVVELAIENGDNGTEDMMNGFIKYIEKNHWMLTAFASKE